MRNIWIRIFSILLSLASLQVSRCHPPPNSIQVYFNWKSFTFDSLPHSQFAEVVPGHRYYDSSSIIPTAISFDATTKCFLFAIARKEIGIPATLAYIDGNKYANSKSPPMRGFPTYEDNYVPGWFGVNDLAEDDYKYNIYPGNVVVKSDDEEVLNVTNGPEEINLEDTNKDKDEEDEGDDEGNDEGEDETRKKHGNKNKPNKHGNQQGSNHGGSNYGNQHGSNYGNQHGSNHGSNYGNQHGSNHGSNYGNQHESSHGSNYGNQHESNHNSNYGNQHGSNHGNVVYVPIPVQPKPSPPPSSSPKPSYKPSKPTYKPSYKPSYKPPIEEEEEEEREPIYKPPYVPHPTPTRKSYHFVSANYNLLEPQCSRFFFVDSGTLAYPHKSIYIRRPVLWAFDILGCDEDSLDIPPVLKVTIPDSVVNDASGFYGISIDVYGSCNEFAVYMANVRDDRIVVYDNKKRYFWYFQSKTFTPGAEIPYLHWTPKQDNFNYGVLSITLGIRDGKGYRDAFYAPGSSYGLFKVSTKTLRNKYIAPGNSESSDFSFVGYRGPNNMAIMTYDDVTQVALFVSLLNNKLTCWNTNLPCTGDNVITLYDDLKFGMDVYIDAKRNIWFMLLDADAETVGDRSKLTHYYYRLYVVPMDALIAGTGCDLSTVKN